MEALCDSGRKVTGAFSSHPYPRIRAAASMLIWQIAQSLNQQGGAQPYLGALEWLAAVVCDDWQDLALTVEQLAAMPALPLLGESVSGERWHVFVDCVAAAATAENLDASGLSKIAVLTAKYSPEDDENAKRDYVRHGLDMGWLELPNNSIRARLFGGLRPYQVILKKD